MAVNNHYLQGELFSPGTNWITFGGYVRFSTVTLGESFDFLRISDGTLSGYHVAFRLGISGRLWIRDADKNDLIELNLGFQADTWYLFEIKFQKKSAPDGGVTLWIDKELVFSAANQNTNSGITFARVEVRTQEGDITPEPASPKCTVYVKSWHVRTDDGVNILDNDTLVGHYTVLGPFNWSAPGNAGDFGNSLTAGKWDNLKEVPLDTSNVGIFSNNGMDGGVTAHDGALPGPAGSESLFDGTILAAKFFWQFQRTGGFGTHIMRGKYGRTKSDEVDPPTFDNTSYTSDWTVTTSYQDRWVLLDASDPNVPGKEDHFQMGFERVSGPGGSHDLSEMWPFILHQEPSGGAMPMAMDHYRRMRKP